MYNQQYLYVVLHSNFNRNLLLIVSTKVITLYITIAAQRKRVVLTTVETKYDITKKFQNNISATK